MSKLQIGVLLPNTGHVAGPKAIREVIDAAENLGVAALWVGDHIALASQQGTDYPYKEGSNKSYEVPFDRPYLEAFVSLGFAAALTRECYLGIGVGILPYRHPLLWAKLIGTVQTLSNGRLHFGIGAGWLKEEFDALGLDYHARGRMTDEILECLTKLPAATESASFQGQKFAFSNMAINPTFSSPKRPLVWIGGNTGAAMRRVAQFGDIWHPHIFGTSPEVLRAKFAEVQEMARTKGRSITGAGLHAPMELADKVGADPWSASLISGPPNYIADTLFKYAEAGVKHVVLTFGGNPQKRAATIEKVMEAAKAFSTR
jgi:probable F420-dependent oxidoreductase